FIQASQLEALKACFTDLATEIATLVKPITDEDGIEALLNPNSPKVVLSKDLFALYFSRSIIPYCRSIEPQNWLTEAGPFYKHIGIYAYRAEILKQITSLPISSLEKMESLEQLRWLESGLRIKVGISNIETIGIDTPEDLKRAEEFLQLKALL
ncbi:MAG: 3-deoxy-manno-octulosonate cytidylyltransferase, partial [Bacteroidaceae bacterium]|nr:3-deoxy-manno-octulosonate cytidylyltransferase [Bacteroidaceae bacterium]